MFTVHPLHEMWTDSSTEVMCQVAFERQVQKSTQQYTIVKSEIVCFSSDPFFVVS